MNYRYDIYVSEDMKDTDHNALYRLDHSFLARYYRLSSSDAGCCLREAAFPSDKQFMVFQSYHLKISMHIA